MYVIVGLGNPGDRYKYTKHNVGFLVIDYLSKKLDINVNRIKFKSLIGEGMYDGQKILLVKPQTYMNLSGESVREIINFYKIDIKNLLVIYDDIDLDLGKLRIRKKGSAGTHNGMRNIIYQIQKDDFPRYRIGISPPPKNIQLVDYVMSKFTDDEMKKLDEVIRNCSSAVLETIENGIEKAMNKYNIR